jgi:hypothetical protein
MYMIQAQIPNYTTVKHWIADSLKHLNKLSLASAEGIIYPAYCLSKLD